MPAKKTPAKPAKSAKAASSASRKAQARSTAKRPVPKPVKPSTPARKPSVKAEPAKAEPAKASRPAAAKAATGDKPAAKPPAPEPKIPESGGAVATPARVAQRAPDTGPIATFVQRNPKPAPIVVDEDGEDSSLLAGPRNVQPYIVKRGEQYMNRGQLDHFRTILASWKLDLMEEVDRTVSHMKDEAANFPDPNDRATQEEEFSLELRTRDRERKLIRKIEEALKRIEDGSYGYCLETGEEIGIKRLEARPVATLSIEAQERRERREKQYGDRDDRYR
jgi:DnaK suppressor protein